MRLKRIIRSWLTRIPILNDNTMVLLIMVIRNTNAKLNYVISSSANSTNLSITNVANYSNSGWCARSYSRSLHSHRFYINAICHDSKNMTNLRKSAVKAQKIIDDAKCVRDDLVFRISIKKFVKSALKRHNPAMWLEKVEQMVKKMRKILGISSQTTAESVHIPPPAPRDTVQNTEHNASIPTWLQTMHKSKRIRGVSR